MSSTKNHKPLINYKKIAKLQELSEKFDLSQEEEISPLRNSGLKTIPPDEANSLIQDLIEGGIQKDNFPNPNIIPPSGDNNLGAKEMFYQRKYYKDYAFPDGATDFSSGGCETEYSNYKGVSRDIFAPPKAIDLLYRKSLYGKVDDCGVIVYPSEIFLKPVIPVEEGTVQSTFLINFVADQYYEMNKYIKKLGDSGKIDTMSSNYFPFIARTGWMSIHEEYHKHIEGMYDVFMSEYLMTYENLKRIRNFGDWLNIFMDYLDFMLNQFPISRTNYILKNDVNPRISGLTFEVTDGSDYSNDAAKYGGFIKDKNFVSITDIAKRYGFFIDKNAPWRFIADINSVPMRNRMREDYGYENIKEMFDEVYYKSYLYDMEIIKTYITSFYNSFAAANPVTNIIYPNIDRNSTRKIITRDTIDAFIMTDKQMLALYYYIRAKESSKRWTQQNFDFEVDYAWGIFKSRGHFDALNYINEKTNIPFSNGGNPSNRYRIQVKDRIIDNPNSSKSPRTFKFNYLNY